MNKATKAIRRSSIRLKSMSSGHYGLKMVIADLKDVKSASRKLIDSQDTMWKDMAKWSKNEKNKAFSESFQVFLELNDLWKDVQMEFLEHLNKVRYQFETIFEAEVNVDKMKDQLTSFEARQAKLEKELQKNQQKSLYTYGGRENERLEIEHKIKDTKTSIKTVQNQISENVAANEIMKVVGLKGVLTELSESYLDLAMKCNYIFQSHKEVANGLPEPSENGMQSLKYGTSQISSQAVLKAKEAIKSNKHTLPFEPRAPPTPMYGFIPSYQISPPQYPYVHPQLQPVNYSQASVHQSMEGATGWPLRYSNEYHSPP